jgi:RNA polymerase sigma-70 factor (ECF subfamily)
VATETAPAQSIVSLETEMDLARRLRQADPSAHAELFSRFGPALHGFAASRLSGDEQLAEEIAVQSLGAAVTTIRRFNPRKSNLRTWLYGIARRLVYVELRRQSRRKSVPPSAQVPIAELPELSDGDDMAASVTSRLEAQRQISELSRILSEAEMEVLTLHYVEQFSLEEIGRIMGRSRRAIDSLLTRARQKARERLASNGQ